MKLLKRIFFIAVLCVSSYIVLYCVLVSTSQHKRKIYLHSNEAMFNTAKAYLPDQRHIPGQHEAIKEEDHEKTNKDHCENFELRNPKYINTRWQSFTHPSSQMVSFVVMGTYFDHRNVDNQHAHTILITGVATMDLSPTARHHKTVDITIYCYAWYKGSKLPVRTQVQISRLDKWTFQVNGERRYQLSIKCKNDSGLYMNNIQTPSHVSLTFEPCVSYVKVELKYPIRENYMDVYGICVPPLYSKLDPRESLALIEWIELNRLYGVTEINFYDVALTLDKILETIFKYYTSKGVVNVHKFPPPVENNTEDYLYDVSQMAVRATINDCIIMNSYRYMYAIVLDIDELLVPYGFRDYKSLFHHIENTTYRANVTSGFLFHSLDFFLDFKPQIEEKHHDWDILLSNQYTKYNYTYGKVKPAINPRHCALAYNHQCLLLVQTTSTGDKGVPRDIAAIHHYRRNCSQGYNTAGGRVKQMNRQKKCQQKMSGAVEYNEELYDRREEIYQKVTSALKDMGLSGSNLPHY